MPPIRRLDQEVPAALLVCPWHGDGLTGFWLERIRANGKPALPDVVTFRARITWACGCDVLHSEDAAAARARAAKG
jgi:hypothetical protein